MVRSFCSSVLGVPISLGAIQKIIDRASKGIKPHYEAIRDKARPSKVNYLDETPWHNAGTLNWLWVMANSMVAFFMIHSRRSKEAFEKLIGAWEGIQVSDNYFKRALIGQVVAMLIGFLAGIRGEDYRSRWSLGLKDYRFA